MRIKMHFNLFTEYVLIQIENGKSLIGKNIVGEK